MFAWYEFAAAVAVAWQTCDGDVDEVGVQCWLRLAVVVVAETRADVNETGLDG